MIQRLFVLLVGVALAASVCLAQQAPKKAAAPAAKPKVTAVAPDDLKWGPPPAGAMKGTPSVDPGGDLQTAVVYGDPSKPGYYVLRGKCADGYKIAPHWHPTTENVTILRGSVALGMGKTFDESKLKALPAGGFASVPPHMAHFAQCKGDTIFQVDGSGPFVLNFISATPAPAKTKAPASK
jgi:quercetin dioxygenase-like cupin family protein